MSSPSRLKQIHIRSLARLIRPAGYYNVKALRVKNFIDYLADHHGLSLDKLSHRKTAALRNELLSVSGIGPETCDSILLYAFKRPSFVVDAYTKRIFSRHGLFREDVGYDEVKRIFTQNIPRDRRVYSEYHALIVRLGKEICRKAPKCGACPLAR